jgi:SAM-dependent methyltransferase
MVEIEQIISNYKHNNDIPQWDVPDAFKQAKEVTYRDEMGKHLLAMSADEIVRYYAYHSFDEMEQWLAVCKQYVSFRGIGVELGAGCGVMSAVFAKQKTVNAILAVEVVESMTNDIMPKVAQEYLGTEAHKVVPVVGTFDKLHLPNESVDFIIEMDSLHHSHNLIQSFAESARILKKGGHMVLLDRCHPDSLTDDAVNALLDVVYTEDWIEHNFYPKGSILTRRENGEHEYRKREWLEAIKQAGLSVKVLAKAYKPILAVTAGKNVLGYVRDVLFGKRFNANGAILKEAKIWLTQTFGIRTFVKNEFEVLSVKDGMNHTLFVLSKK